MLIIPAMPTAPKKSPKPPGAAPKEHAKVFGVRLRDNILQGVRSLAKQRGVNPSSIVQMAVAEYLERNLKA